MIHFNPAPDIQKRLVQLIKQLDFNHINPKNIHSFRSTGSRSRARARIWSFPKIWQLALKTDTHYAIEVLAEKFDHLRHSQQTKILIHELLHIPRTFSGGLRPHRTKTFRLNQRLVNKYFKNLNS